MHNQALAALGDRDAALRMFEVTAPQPDGSTEPFLLLDGAHLDRWRGHVLSVTGDREATSVIREALSQHDGSFRRASASTHLDLSIALAAEGDWQEARQEVSRAAEQAAVLGSRRLERRSRRVTLGPTS